MPSQKPSMIDALRAKHDPHYQLAGKVEGLEKDLPIQVAQLHKTLSKSFAMQRKTLVRVLGLEKRIDELEAAKESVQEAVEQLEVSDDIPEELDELIDDVRQEKEVGGTATKTKPKAKKKPKIKAKKRKVKGKDIKPKIDAEKFKKGTALDDGFASRVHGVDDEGEYLSKEERIAKFKGKALAKPEDLKPEDKEDSSDVDSEDIKQEDKAEIGEDQDKLDKIIKFLNADVKDKLDEINQSAIEIKDVLATQGDLADDRDEALRQSILSDKKKQRENKLENKKKSLGDKIIDKVTKPVGNFLNKIIKFVMMTFVGSQIARIINLLKDPAQILDPIKRFFNFAIGLVNAVMKGLWNITGAPMNFIIGGINKGVSSLLDSINKATGLLKIPPIEAPQIPLIPGPPQHEYIPLSKTAQERNEGAVGMAGGGVVPGSFENITNTETSTPTKNSSDPFSFGKKFVSPEEAKERVAAMGMPSMELMDGTVVPDFGKMGGEGVSQGLQLTRDIMVENGASPDRIAKLDQLMAMPDAQPESIANKINQIVPGSMENTMMNVGADISAKAKMSGGGIVPGPYPTTNLLGMGHNVIDTAPNNIMGYNKGGKVPGKGEGDTVPAMLTPGEFVMSKGAVDQIGAEKLMAMNAAGGGTNQPKLMKFAGGGMVPGIDPPSGRGGGVVVIGGGGKQSSQASSSAGTGVKIPSFSSTDPNNITTPVVKSLYNIMG